VTIVRALNDFNYEVQLENRKQIFHYNMLKAYNESSEHVGVVLAAETDNSEDELPTTVELEDDDADRSFNIGCQLADEQRIKLLMLLSDFKHVFTERTGRTHLVGHNIVLTDNKPCSQPPYKIPDALKEQVEEQITKLLENGFIQESQSSYSAPLLAVKNRGNKIRLVNNFKRLNDITQDDGYLMADPAEILTKAAGAKFVSTKLICVIFFLADSIGG
jgi:hypothetical protein